MNPQHTALSTVGSQSLGAILWQAPVDLDPQYSGNELLIHYGSPLVTAANTVIVPVKTGASSGFEIQARSGTSGALEWTLPSDYVLQPGHGYAWIPSYSPTLTPAERALLCRGRRNGDVHRYARCDRAGASASSRLAFYGIANYNANPSAYNSNIFIDTPITTDASGDIFFGFIASGPETAGINKRHRPHRRRTAWEAGLRVVSGCRRWRPIPPRRSATTATRSTSSRAPEMGTGKLVAMNSQTLAVTAQVALVDPHTGSLATITNDATASPTRRARRRRLFRRAGESVPLQ